MFYTKTLYIDSIKKEDNKLKILLDLSKELMLHIMTYLTPIDIDNMAMINDYFKRLSVDKDVIEAKRQFVYNELFISKGPYRCMCYVQDNEDK